MTFFAGARHALLGLLMVVAMSGSRAWEQDRFAISMWVDPIVPKDQFPKYYQDMANANFTVLLGGFGATDPASVEASVKAAEAAGLRSIVGGWPYLSNRTSPSLWGYQLKDEPSAVDYPTLANWTKRVAAERPGKLAFINLFPTGATYAQLGNLSYSEYVARFVSEVAPDLLCMDHYPDFRDANGIGKANYRANVRVLREAAFRARIPFWNFFATQVVGSNPDPTEAELRWQVFTSVAYGAKGVLYFTYWNGGIVSGKNGTHTKHYDQAKRINSHLLAYERYLLKASSVGAWYVESPGVANESVSSQLSGAPVSDLQGPANGSYLVGAFELQDGRFAALIQNQDEKTDLEEGELTLVFEGGPRFVSEVDPVTGVENWLRQHPATGAPAATRSASLGLLAGGARLLVFGWRSPETAGAEEAPRGPHLAYV